MSDEQRPVRVRVVNGGGPQPNLQRRSSDRAARTIVAPENTVVATPNGRIAVARIVLFLAGCAAGGAIVTASGVLGVLGL